MRAPPRAYHARMRHSDFGMWRKWIVDPGPETPPGAAFWRNVRRGFDLRGDAYCGRRSATSEPGWFPPPIGKTMYCLASCM